MSKYANIRLKNHHATAFPIDNIFDRWGIDIVGGLPITKQGYRGYGVSHKKLKKPQMLLFTFLPLYACLDLQIY